ncbi:MAG TPA: UbiA family prenyltransferase [Bacteroidales bacterium]
MKKVINIILNHIYKIFQYLSLDVALGSIGSSVLAVKTIGVTLPSVYWLILPLCVWIIYTSDHLLDALKVREEATMGRHLFHFIHRKAIAIFLCLAGALAILLILRFLDGNTIIFGAFISFLIFLYLLSNHFASRVFRYFPRELIIAAGYTAGTWGIPILSKYPLINRSDLLFFLNNFLIILSIPLLYSIYEYDADRMAGFVSFATSFGVKITELTVLAILALSSLVSAWSVFFLQENIGFIMLLMTIALLVILFFRRKFSINEKYRIIGDSTTFLPFLLLV